MNRLNKLRGFINREKIYMWLLVFILFMNALILLTGDSEVGFKQKVMRETKDEYLKKEYSLTPEKFKALIEEKREVAVAFNLLFLSVMLFLVIGIALDIYFFFNRAQYKLFLKDNIESAVVGWDVWDVCKGVILFLFFGYILIAIESSLAGILPLIKEKGHYRAMINSSLLDAVAIIFVLYIAIIEHKEPLKKLGLSLSSFFKNVFTGIIGYISAFPVIIGVLFLVIWLAKFFNYESPVEPVLRLFLEEKNTVFILYSTIFVTVLGPVFEEIFFRGFMYSALRKRIGIAGAIITSSVLFSLLHTNVVGFLPIMVLGSLLAYLYERTNSLVSPIIVHIIHNTGMMTFVFLIKELKL